MELQSPLTRGWAEITSKLVLDKIQDYNMWLSPIYLHKSTHTMPESSLHHESLSFMIKYDTHQLYLLKMDALKQIQLSFMAAFRATVKAVMTSG